MTTIALIAVVGCCFVGWVKRWMLSEMMIMLFEDREYPKPTDQEIKLCAKRLAKKIVKRDF